MARTVAKSPGMERVTLRGGDDKLASLFQPDVLLSAQYFDALRRKTLLEAEKRLMFVVLNDAISCYQGNLFSQHKKNRRLFDEAEAWMATPGGEGIFCFDNICESLGFNPEYVRRVLLRWKNQLHRTQSSSVAWDANKLAS